MESNCLSEEKEYYQLIKEREALGTTGLVDGVAIPHSRVHDSYLLYDSFIVIAFSPTKLPFGSLDGKMTDLFIMPCANDDRVHLYMLARIALMLQKTDLADGIRQCQSAAEVIDTINQIESDFVAKGI